MEYRVSEKYLKRKRIEPIFSGLWGLLLGCLVFVAESIPWFVSTGVIIFMVAITGGSNWLGSKRIIESLSSHYLELRGSTLLFVDKAMSSEVDLNSIHQIVIDKKKGNVVSVFIERVKGQREKLPPYSDLNGLVKQLISIVPPEKVKVRGWFHL